MSLADNMVFADKRYNFCGASPITHFFLSLLLLVIWKSVKDSDLCPELHAAQPHYTQPFWESADNYGIYHRPRGAP